MGVRATMSLRSLMAWLLAGATLVITFAALWTRPFIIVTMGIVASTIIYYAHEGWFWHNSERLECLYWRLVGGLLTAALLLCPDSPVEIQ